jgi:hypothetical protein
MPMSLREANRTTSSSQVLGPTTIANDIRQQAVDIAEHACPNSGRIFSEPNFA